MTLVQKSKDDDGSSKTMAQGNVANLNQVLVHVNWSCRKKEDAETVMRERKFVCADIGFRNNHLV
jgi:hypothetical protein